MQRTNLKSKKGLTIYMHFSFKQPKGEKYGIFAQVCYIDRECKKRITYNVTADELWYPNDQHLNAVQSYYKALEFIYQNQANMIKNGIDNVVLVTSSGILTKWILGQGRKSSYTYFLEEVTAPFRFGEPKSLQVGVGIMSPVTTDRVKRYCVPDRASNMQDVLSKVNSPDNKKYALKAPKKAKSIFDVIEDEEYEIAPGMIEL